MSADYDVRRQGMVDWIAGYCPVHPKTAITSRHPRCELCQRKARIQIHVDRTQAHGQIFRTARQEPTPLRLEAPQLFCQCPPPGYNEEDNK